MSLKELAQLVLEQKIKEKPNVPKHAIPPVKFTDKTANGLQKAIIAFFEVKGIEAWRQSSEGRYIQPKTIKNVMGQTVTVQKGKFIPRGKKAGKGAGDVVATLPPWGKSCHIEVKIGADKQRDSQKEFQAKHEAMGGIYMIVKTWDEFIDKIKPWVSSVSPYKP